MLTEALSQLEIEAILNATPYAQMVSTLSKPGESIRASLTAQDCHNLHMAVGIAGEGGELLDAIKAATIYRKPLDRANVIEELGDLEFFMEGLRQSLGITRDETLAANVIKLGERYAKLVYSDQQAQDRADKQVVAESLRRADRVLPNIEGRCSKCSVLFAMNCSIPDCPNKH